jgi:hypothetical protein
MKTSTSFPVMIGLLSAVLLTGSGSWAQPSISPELKQQATTLVESMSQAYQSKNVDAMMELFDPDLAGDVRATYAVAFERIFGKNFRRAESTLTSIQPTASRVALTVSVVEHYTTKEGKPERQPQSYILFARQKEGQLVLCEFAQVILGEDFDPATRVYRSSKGRYSLQIPERWTPVKAPLILQGIAPDSVCFMAPDLESSCTLGFVQLPMSVEVKDAVYADVAVAKRLTRDHKILEEGSASVAELDGYYVISEFSELGAANESGEQHLPLSKGARRRMRVYLSSPPLLYFFVFDAIPPGVFDKLKPDFSALAGSFAILPADEDRTPEEMVAEQLAHGAVSGRVYTSEEFNCFIAAPDGWEIRTSPNPAHLVEMRYSKGKSIARLLAAKGLPPGPDVLKTSFEARLEAVKGIVENFNETSRRDVTIHGVPAIESIHTYSLEGLGRFHIKEVTVVRDDTYYLILCQAIEPDAFIDLEPHFDQIIESFGFIQ